MDKGKFVDDSRKGSHSNLSLSVNSENVKEKSHCKFKEKLKEPSVDELPSLYENQSKKSLTSDIVQITVVNDNSNHYMPSQKTIVSKNSDVVRFEDLMKIQIQGVEYDGISISDKGNNTIQNMSEVHSDKNTYEKKSIDNFNNKESLLSKSSKPSLHVELDIREVSEVKTNKSKKDISVKALINIDSRKDIYIDQMYSDSKEKSSNAKSSLKSLSIVSDKVNHEKDLLNDKREELSVNNEVSAQ